MYANQTEGDILLRSELDALAAARPDVFKLYYTCDRWGARWVLGQAGLALRVSFGALARPSLLLARAARGPARARAPTLSSRRTHLLRRDVSEGWAYGRGHINEEMLRGHTLPPGEGSIVAMCGPPGLINFACLPNLEAIGHAKEAMIQF